MYYELMELNDGTTIVFSNIEKINGKETIKVKMERWSEAHDDFDSMEIELPEGRMSKVVGYDKEEVENLEKYILHMEPLIFKFSRQGGIGKRRK